MHLVVDAQTLQTSAARRGIGRYARNLLQALARTRPAWRIEVVLNAALPRPAPDAIPPHAAVQVFSPPFPMTPGTRLVNEHYFGDWVGATGAEIVLELSVFEEEGLVPRFVAPRPWLAGMAYDLVPVLFHERYLEHPAAHAIYRERFRQALQADLLLAISETTRKDVMRLMRLPPARVVTIGGAAERLDRALRASASAHGATVLERFGLDRPFLLCVGGTDPRKNLHGALAAFASLPPDVRAAHQLAIVCALTPEQRLALEHEAESIGIGRQLRLTGYVEDADLQALYDRCRLTLFPTFYEGLGLPVLEALMSGAPVVASNRSSIPEFAGDAARLVDPSSPRAMAAAIEEELKQARDDGEGDRRAFASRFTWEAVAARAAAAIERLTASRPGAGGRRSRIAWVSAVPPVASASARWSARLLPRLREQFEIALVVNAGSTVARGFAQGSDVLRPDEVWSRHVADPFDLFVYHLEDHDSPGHVVAVARWRSGLVVLHGAAILARSGELAQVVAGSEAVLVHGSAEWQALRRRPGPTVFCLPDDDAAAADAYAAAIRLTLANRRSRDGEWCDVASSALAEADGVGPAIRGALIDRWVTERIAARTARPDWPP